MPRSKRAVASGHTQTDTTTQPSTYDAEIKTKLTTYLENFKQETDKIISRLHKLAQRNTRRIQAIENSMLESINAGDTIEDSEITLLARFKIKQEELSAEIQESEKRASDARETLEALVRIPVSPALTRAISQECAEMQALDAAAAACPSESEEASDSDTELSAAEVPEETPKAAQPKKKLKMH